MEIRKRHMALFFVFSVLIFVTGACRTLKSNSTDRGGFSLVYVRERSELPHKSELRINSSGEFRYIRDLHESAPSIVDSGAVLSGTLSKDDFDVTIAMLVYEMDFFQLPASKQGDKSLMDASAETVTLSYKGQTSTIKDYAASPIDEYSLLTSFLQDFVQRIQDHAEGQKTSKNIDISHRRSRAEKSGQ
jgi:hypothetical protein